MNPLLAFESCHIMVIIHIDHLHVSRKITPHYFHEMPIPRGETATESSMSVHPNCFNTHNLSVHVFCCSLNYQTPNPNYKKNHEKLKNIKKTNITQKTPRNNCSSQPTKKEPAKTIHPNKTNPTPTSHHQATY